MIEFFTSVYFLVPLSIFVICISIYIIKISTKILVYNKLSNITSKDSMYVYDILANHFSDKNVIRDVSLISDKAMKNSDGNVMPHSDIVYIGKCGVILMTVITNKGEFDNPKTGNWRYRYKNSSGDVVIEDKANPFDATIPQIRVVSDLLKNEGVYNNCIKRMVVYTQNKIRFTYDYKEIVNVDHLISVIEKYNKKSVLTAAEIRYAYSSIQAYSEFLKNNS